MSNPNAKETEWEKEVGPIVTKLYPSRLNYPYEGTSQTPTLCGNASGTIPTPDTPPGGDPRFYQLLDIVRDLHGKKNTDYSKGLKEGPLGNFIRVAYIKKLYPGLDWASPLGTALTYMLKQLDAAFVLEATHRESITGEDVGERLKDVAVYALLSILLKQDAKE